MIVKVLHNPDGSVKTRTVVSYQKHDGHQGIEAIKNLLNKYPDHGWNPDEGPWARDSQGQKFTFVCHPA